MIKTVTCSLSFLLFLCLLTAFYFFAWILLHHVIIGGDELKILVSFTFDWQSRNGNFEELLENSQQTGKLCIQNGFL